MELVYRAASAGVGASSRATGPQVLASRTADGRVICRRSSTTRHRRRGRRPRAVRDGGSFTGGVGHRSAAQHPLGRPSLGPGQLDGPTPRSSTPSTPATPKRSPPACGCGALGRRAHRHINYIACFDRRRHERATPNLSQLSAHTHPLQQVQGVRRPTPNVSQFPAITATSAASSGGAAAHPHLSQFPAHTATKCNKFAGTGRRERPDDGDGQRAGAVHAAADRPRLHGAHQPGGPGVRRPAG